MSLYYFIFVWIVIMAIISEKATCTEYVNINGKKERRWKFFWALVAFVPVIYLAAFTAPRSDTVAYVASYQRFHMSLGSILSDIRQGESEQGWVLFQWMIKSLFGEREWPFRLILALLHSIPVLYIYRKYSENYLLSLYLFVAGGVHTAWMMNGLRQFLAVCIIMAATPLMLKKKYVPTILIILLASTIHTSALIMLPVIFIVQGKPWNWKTLLFIAASIAGMVIFGNDIGLMDEMLVDTEYEGAIQNALDWGDNGEHPLQMLVSSVPVLLAFIGRKQLAKENDAMINLCVNMSIISLGINLVAVTTSGILIGRLPIYVSLYSYILLPHLVKKLFTPNSSKIMTVLMIALYYLYHMLY